MLEKLRENKRSIYFISGLVCFFAGVILLVMKQVWALVLFLVGLGLLAAGCSVMLQTAGYRGEGAFFHGLNGQGRQQSEVVKLDAPVPAENAAIWDQMEKQE